MKALGRRQTAQPDFILLRQEDLHSAILHCTGTLWQHGQGSPSLPGIQRLGCFSNQAGLALWAALTPQNMKLDLCPTKCWALVPGSVFLPELPPQPLSRLSPDLLLPSYQSPFLGPDISSRSFPAQTLSMAPHGPKLGTPGLAGSSLKNINQSTPFSQHFPPLWAFMQASLSTRYSGLPAWINA